MTMLHEVVVGEVPDGRAADDGAACRALAEGDAALALSLYEGILADRPDHLPAMIGRGAALRTLGRQREALMVLLQALSRDPGNVDGRTELAKALAGLGRAEDARTVYSILVRSPETGAEAWVGLAALLAGEGREAAALACLRRALTLDPGHLEGRLSLARLLARRGDLTGAVDAWHDALALAPQNAEAHAGLGRMLVELGRLDEAEDQLERALVMDDENVEARLARARLRLLKGNLSGAWEDYQWRWQLPGVSRPNMPGDAWDGSPLEGRTILLWSEQGLGATLHLLRYVPLVAGRGGRVVLALHPSLLPLAEGLEGVALAVADGSTLPAGWRIDVNATLVDLPRLFATTLGEVPGREPYLALPPGRRPPIGSPPKAPLKVGLCWAGAPTPDRHNDIPFELLLGLTTVQGASFFSLQMGPPADDLNRLAHPSLVEDLQPTIADYADLAGRIAEMDVVISVDSAVAHLAGALGKTVWVMLSPATDWRWMARREDSPWYPSARLFRQDRPGDWTGVVTRIGALLTEAARDALTRQAEAAAAAAQGGDALRSFLAAHLQPGDLFIDIGAGDGTYTLDAACHPSGEVAVLALEPDAGQAELLRDTVAISGVEELVEVAAAAAGDRAGVALSSRKPRALGRRVFPVPDWVAGAVPVISVDTLLADRPHLAERRMVVRLGPGGSDAAALEGMWEPVMMQRAAVVLLNHHADSRAAEILAEAGYSLYRLPDGAASGVAVEFEGEAGPVLALAFGLSPAERYGDGSAEDALQAEAEARRLTNEGIQAQGTGKWGMAAYLLGRALAFDPGNAVANANLGICARRMRRLAAAAVFYRRALANGAPPAIWANLGNVLRELGRFGEAEAAFMSAVSAHPDDAGHLRNLALLERERGRPREAVALFERALALAPGNGAIKAELAEALLKSGEFGKGFALFSPRRIHPEAAAPAWDGSALDAGSILIQDDGDAIDAVQLSRFVAQVGRHGGLVTLECVPELARLLATLPGVEQVVPRGQPLPATDWRVSLGDVPRLLGTTTASLPRDVPYLHLPDDLPTVSFPADGRLRVGLAWAGRERERHCPLARLLPLAAHPDVVALSLQRGPAAEQLGQTGAKAFIEDLAPRLGDLADSAAHMAGLDLVVAGNTAEAHIAAAMGKPVWVVLPNGADWRWVDGRDDTPWYPTMRVFRQTADGGWDRAIARMSEALAAMAARKRSGR